MYEVLVLLTAAAPVPAPRPLPEFKPGTYGFKWAGSEWGQAYFSETGFYVSKYATKNFDGEFHNHHYEGSWSWNPKERILTIKESYGPLDPERKPNNFFRIKFGRKLDVGKVEGVETEVHLK